jgi:hypothetical protein
MEIIVVALVAVRQMDDFLAVIGAVALQNNSAIGNDVVDEVRAHRSGMRGN